MKFNIKALSMTAGLLGGFVVLFVSLGNLFVPGYGLPFLDLVASVYPGYRPGTGVSSVIVVTVYGLIDGAIAGALFGWLYNSFAK